MSKKIPVMEIFGPTIQGEGHLAGVQTYFVRFGLCDYKCKMCDSIHAIDGHYVNEHAQWIYDDALYPAVMQHVGLSSTPWITLSGGNPAIHDLEDLVYRLKLMQKSVAIETQGTFSPDWLLLLDCITVAPKGPGMGERFERERLGAFLAKYVGHRGLNLKVVVFDENDLEFAEMINKDFAIPFGLGQRFYLSLGNPVVPKLVNGTVDAGVLDVREHKLMLLDRYRSLAETITHNPNLWNARFFPQLHVLAWSNEQGR